MSKAITHNDIPEALETIQFQLRHIYEKLEAMGKASETPEILTTEEAAQLTRRSVKAIYAYVQARKIPFQKKEGKLTFRKSKLLEWLDEHDEESPESREDRMIQLNKRRK